MSLEPGTAEVTVALDIRHPFAYLALGPAIRLSRELGRSIDWLPLAAQSLHPPSEPADDDDRGTRHKRHRAHMIAREIAVYSDVQGVRIEEPYRSGPSDAVQQGWLWLRERAPRSLEPFLEESFRRYWSVALDPDDLDGVAQVVADCGEDAASFRTWSQTEGPAATARVAEALAQAGVFQAPAYLVRDEVFYGRQHLPMIRWLLEGRPGPGPI